MKKRLSTNIALFEAVLVLLSLTALIVVSVLLSARSVSSSTNSALDATAGENSAHIQSILSEAVEAADDLRVFITTNYGGNTADYKKSERSIVYSNNITSSCKTIESWAIQTGWRKVADNESLVGLGIFFEPKAFDSNIDNYAIYIDDAMAAEETVSMYTEDYTTQSYYMDAVANNQTTISDPFTWNGIYMVSVTLPIEIDGKVIGAVIADISMGNLSKINVDNETHSSMYASIITNHGTIMYDSKNSEAVGASLESQLASPDEYAKISGNFEAGSAFQVETVNSQGISEIRYFRPIEVSGITWWSQTVISTSDFNSAATQLVIWLASLAALTLVVIIVFTGIVLSTKLNPIRSVVRSAKKIENGELDIRVDVKSKDEIGQLALSFRNMTEGLRLIISDIRYLLSEMSNNNFRVTSENGDRYVGEYSKIYESLLNIKTMLTRTLLEIREATKQVSSASDQVSAGAQTLAQGAAEQASSIEELSVSINEISSQLEEAAGSAGSASTITREVGSVIETSLLEMRQLLDAMSDISSASESIRKVIKVIDDIAFQTNILALNAAVEAARAGSAGKGFAVVAEEVKNLAQKSSESAKNTTALIENSVTAVSKGVTLARNASAAFESVSAKAASMEKLVQGISSAAITQSENIKQILVGIEQISGVVQMNSATAEESAAASEELSSQASMLEGLISRFLLDDHTEEIETTPELPEASDPLIDM